MRSSLQHYMFQKLSFKHYVSGMIKEFTNTIKEIQDEDGKKLKRDYERKTKNNGETKVRKKGQKKKENNESDGVNKTRKKRYKRLLLSSISITCLESCSVWREGRGDADRYPVILQRQTPSIVVWRTGGGNKVHSGVNCPWMKPRCMKRK